MLSVVDVHVAYGRTPALTGPSLTVAAGEIVSIIGRNGVGKTTLLKCLMGLLPIRSGEISFDGRGIASLPSHARAALGIGYVPQGRDIFPRLTVEENLQMGLAAQARGARLPEIVFEMFPVLRSMLHRRGGDLSGGQQ